MLSIFILGFVYPLTVFIAAITGAAYVYQDTVYAQHEKSAHDIGD